MELTLASLPADVLADPLAAAPAFFAPFEQAIEASPTMRWSFVQRAFWVHGVSSLAAYAAIARDYDNHPTLANSTVEKETVVPFFQRATRVRDIARRYASSARTGKRSK